MKILVLIKNQKINPFWKKQEIKKMEKMKKETSGNICFFGFLFLIAKELHHLHKVFVGGWGVGNTSPWHK